MPTLFFGNARTGSILFSPDGKLHPLCDDIREEVMSWRAHYVSEQKRHQKWIDDGRDAPASQQLINDLAITIDLVDYVLDRAKLRYECEDHKVIVLAEFSEQYRYEVNKRFGAKTSTADPKWPEWRD